MCKGRLITVLIVLGAVLLVPGTVAAVSSFFELDRRALVHVVALLFAGAWVAAEIGEGELAVRKAAVQVSHACALPLAAVGALWGGYRAVGCGGPLYLASTDSTGFSSSGASFKK